MTTQAPETVTVTGKEIAERIAKKVGSGVPEMLIKVSWFPNIDAVSGMAILANCPENERAGIQTQMKPTVIVLGDKCPFDRGQTVTFIFEDEDEYRLYCMGDDFYIFRLCKYARDYSVAKVQLAAFVDMVSDEMIELRDGVSSAERERAAILEYGEDVSESPNGVPYTLKEFLEDIKEEVHLAGDEPEEPEEPEEASEKPKLTAVPDLPKPSVPVSSGLAATDVTSST